MALNKKKMEPGSLTTSNIYIAAYALATGCRITEVKKSPSGKKSTITLEGDFAEMCEQEYYDGQSVSAQKLFDSYRTLKDRIFERD